MLMMLEQIPLYVVYIPSTKEKYSMRIIMNIEFGCFKGRYGVSDDYQLEEGDLKSKVYERENKFKNT